MTRGNFRGSLWEMLVKICGLMRREDAELAREAGADLLGFIFVPGSRRRLAPDRAFWIRHLRGVEKVGVFRDAPVDFILETAGKLGLDRIQLHGKESDEILDQLDRPVIRRIGAGGELPEVERLDFLNARGVLPLVDPGAGDGVAADWTEIGIVLENRSFALAGGLRPENVAEAIAKTCPIMVDVSSGVESIFGQKDPLLVEAFISAARLSEF